MEWTYYPGFDVMEAQEAWDPHTREIVAGRLGESPPLRVLTPGEMAVLRPLLGHLLDEEREEILAFVAGHIDGKLGEPIGEAQRKQGVPPAAQLVREGLIGLDDAAKHRRGRPFAECSAEEQLALMRHLQAGSLEAVGLLQGLPQKEFFAKLLSLALEAYTSHPRIWSEMGYAGPAYPRGYYRIERGLTDPWEPKAPRVPGESGERRESKASGKSGEPEETGAQGKSGEPEGPEGRNGVKRDEL